jgi:hypothetical protein
MHLCLNVAGRSTWLGRPDHPRKLREIYAAERMEPPSSSKVMLTTSVDYNNIAAIYCCLEYNLVVCKRMKEDNIVIYYGFFVQKLAPQPPKPQIILSMGVPFRVWVRCSR